MNLLTAAEIDRRGMAAIDEALCRGPVYLTKRNRATAVVVSAQQYARLSGSNIVKESGMTAVQWLLNLPVKGRKSKQQMDAARRRDRDDWA